MKNLNKQQQLIAAIRCRLAFGIIFFIIINFLIFFAIGLQFQDHNTRPYAFSSKILCTKGSLSLNKETYILHFACYRKMYNSILPHWHQETSSAGLDFAASLPVTQIYIRLEMFWNEHKHDARTSIRVLEKLEIKGLKTLCYNLLAGICLVHTTFFWRIRLENPKISEIMNFFFSNYCKKIEDIPIGQ